MGMHETDIVMDPVTEVACTDCQHPLDVSGLPPFTEIACPECGTPQVVPTKLGNFLLLGLLGKGGMGAVYRGLDTSLDRPVAVKVMLTSLGENKEFVETFRREAQAAAALNHPNIVQTYSFGVAHGQPYMVMELLDGGRFDQMIARGDPLNEALVLKIGADVAEGLNAAAGIGLVHGDVKPENILLDSSGVAKVVDFGLARFKKGGEATAQGIWGTPYYIAPEKIRGQPADARSDIYSLGATLFHALAAKPPFDGDTPLDVVKARLKVPAPALKTLRPDIHPEVEAIIARTLEADPVKRYPNYTSLLADIRKVLATLKPAPAAFGQVSKRGGKIVLTRKKGAGAGPKLNITGIDPVVAASEEAPVKRPSRKKRILWISLGTVGALLLVWLIVWMVFAYRAEVKRWHAAEEEAAALQALRKTADKAWLDMLVTFTNTVKRADGLKSPKLGLDVNLAREAITRDASNLTDQALAAEAAAKTPELCQSLLETFPAEAGAAVATLRSLTNAVGTNLHAVTVATNVLQARSALAALTNLLPEVQSGGEQVVKAADRTQSTFKELLALKKKVADAAAVQAAEKKRIEAEKAEEARRQRAEAEAQKRAKELAAKTEQELARLEEVRKANGPLLQQCRFNEAAEALAALESGMTTDASKTAFKTATERYRLVLDLKTALIEGIGKDAKASPDGFKYGWLVGGVPTLDVLGADETKIVLRGRTETWDHVTPAQLLRFVKRYSEDPDLGRKEAARMNLAAAVYLFEAGGGNERAQKLAAEQLSKAVARDATLADKAKALLPDVPAGP